MRFDLLFGVGDGVGEAFFDFGEAVAVGVGVGCFVECFRCFAEVAASIAPNKITRIRSHFIIRRCSVCYSAENRVQYFGRMPSGQCSLQHVKEIGRLATASPSRWRTGCPPAPQTPAFAKASAWQEMSVLRLRELLQDCFVQTNSAFEIFERKIFVW